MKKGKIYHKFPGSNTPQGFHSFYADGLKDMERIFILKGGPGTGKSTLMRKLGYNLSERGYDVELWQCSSDNESLDGVIVNALKVAVVDGTSPHIVDPVYPGAVDEIINLGDHWDQESLRDHRREIKELTQQISSEFSAAYADLAAWKQEYDAAADSAARPNAERLSAIGNEIIGQIFTDELARVRHFFAGAITPRGWVGYNQELSAECGLRFVIYGGDLQAVHSLNQAVLEAAVIRGHDVDIYHSTLDPACYEMLVLPDLNIAVVDSNVRGLEALAGDVLIELQPLAAKLIPDDETADTEQQAWLKAAVDHIAQAKSLHNDLEDYYIAAMKFDEIDAVCKRVFQEIWQLAAAKESE